MSIKRIPTASRPVIDSLEALQSFRLTKARALAEGTPVPVPILPMEQALPARVKGVVEAIDRLLPRLLAEKSLTLGTFFGVEEEHARGQSTPWHRTIAGANALAVAGLAAELTKQVSGVGDLCAMALGLHAGWKGAGGFGYLTHWAFDNYDQLGDLALEFQLHHELPGDVATWQPAVSVYSSGVAMLPLLLSALALEPSVGLGSAALSFLGGAVITPLSHQWQHIKAPEWVQALRRVGIFGTPQDHHRHHGGDARGLVEGERPRQHVGSYDILSGHLGGGVNELFDKLEIPRRLERAIFLLTEKMTGTGVEPNAWKEYPELKQIWTAPPSEREAVKRTLRMARLRQNLETKTAQLADAQARGPIDEPSRAVLASYPAKIAKMEVQLKALESGLDPIVAEVTGAERELSALSTPLGLRAQGGRESRLKAAQAKLTQAIAQLKEGAPWLLA